VIRAALERLTAEGVAFATRGEQPIDDPPPGGDVDILVGAADLATADRALKAAGFVYQETPGHRGHRFYLAYDAGRGRWLKLDVNVVPERLGWDLAARDDAHLRRFAAYRVGPKADPGLAERVWSAAARRRPLGWRRRGPVVAVLGPDGAGKGAVIAGLRAQIQTVVRPVYFGQGGASASDYAPSGSGRRARQSFARPVKRWMRALLDRLPRGARAGEWRLRQALVASVRAWIAYAYAWRGDIVLCDRHPLEALAIGPDAGDRVSRTERAILGRLVPWPDAVILLDAPGDVLFERKREHSPGLLDERRRAYREVFGARGAVVVPTDGALEESVARAAEVVWAAFRARREA
jgi:hypothetical protein